MTRAQQTAAKHLEEAQAEYLMAHGWSPNGKFWSHPRIKIAARFTAIDALAQTRAEPMLGWP